MRYLRRAGYPVPEVLAVDGPDLVMERLHQIAASVGLPHRVGPGEQVMHLDLHPENVMLTPRGPVVIDWTNASAGPAGADVAMTYVILTTTEIDGLPPGLSPAARALLRVFVSRFLAAVRDDPAPHLPGIIEHRLRDPNVRPVETARLLVAGQARGAVPPPGLIPLPPPYGARPATHRHHRQWRSPAGECRCHRLTSPRNGWMLPG